MLIKEPKWKSWVVETNGVMFTPKLCQEIIDLSKTLEQKESTVNNLITKEDTIRQSTISWIPFDKMQPVYNDINDFIQRINRNHFGFENIQITEEAQVSSYSKGQFYEWHTDTRTNMKEEPPVRKLSMTLLLNDPSEFEGGNLEIANNEFVPMKQGHATIFASFLQHRVTPITKGVRKSLVMWFGGEPFK
jgi:PKHD-type hydroxylase